MKFSSDLSSDDSLSADRYVRRYHVVATSVCVAGLIIAVYSIWQVDSSTFQTDSTPPASMEESTPIVEVFDLEESRLPREKIVIGNPFKDAIPTLTEPQYVTADQANYLNPQDQVIGYAEEGAARAYPLKIMDWHEAVNDQLAGVPYVITYCPLCRSVAAFDRSTSHGRIRLGVSGFLYNSNVLFYDKTAIESPGLFSQLAGVGISQRLKDIELKSLPVELTTWKDWKSRHPDTEVLSQETGFDRNYQESPYEKYFADDKLMFPIGLEDERYPRKTLVLGIQSGDQSRAYAYSEFSKVWKETTIQQSLNGHQFELEWNPEAQSLRVVSADEGITWNYAFWFAWYAFHPETEVYATDEN